LIKKKVIIALVPAKGNSKGIKLKNLKKIGKKSLIELTSDFIDKVGIFNLKILSSENERILKLASKLNFYCIKRPKKLSSQFISDYQVIKHSIGAIKKIITADYIVYLQPTSPIRRVSHLNHAIKEVINKNLDGAWSVSLADKKNHPLKILFIDKNKNLKLFDKRGKKIVARQMLNNIYIRNGVFYIFSIKSLIKQKTIYLKKIYPSITNYETSNIDTFLDLKDAKMIYNKNSFL
jgi:CMP-N,N'-diacetyllegionaminic acid synthase